MLYSRRAFTLIELALVLVVVSLMTGFGLQAFETTGSVNCNAITRDKLQVIDKSLQTFAATYSRFPKPARMQQGSNNPGFGYEAQAVGATNPALPAYATSAPGTGVVNTSGVLIGALPHAALGLPADYAIDCWGNKFTYAVTNSQTSSEENVGYPSANVGTIELRTGTLSSNQQLSPLITYVVVSHGEDKFGGTPMSAGDIAVRNCNASTAGKVDRHNCNNDGVFYSSVTNTGSTDAYFDDLLIYSSKIQSKEDCANQSFTWNTNCNTMSGVITHGSTTTITASGSWSGSASVTCKDSKLTLNAGATCVPTAPCSGGTITWNNSGSAAGPCSASVGDQDHGFPYNGLNNTISGYNGSVTVTCTNGAWTGYSPRICNPNTCTGSLSWGPGNACSGSVTDQASGSTNGVSYTGSTHTGNATFSCTAGSLSITGTPTCTSITNPCSAGSVSWGGGNCNYSMPGMTHGQTPISVSNAASGFTGGATVGCNNGTFSVSGSTCNQHCTTGGSVNWGGNCSGIRPSINHGNSGSINNTAAGYTGSATVSCTNGTYSALSSTTCDVDAIANGSLFCWGQNTVGQLGNNTTTGRPAPARVIDPVGVSSWRSVTTAFQYSCGIGNNGRLYCWGAAGFIGDGTSNASLIPVSVLNPTGVTTWNSVNATSNHSCAIGNNGQAYCWGDNITRQIGDNTNTWRTAPTLVTNPSGVTSWYSIAAGNFHSCGIGNNGRAYCWGQNSFGEIGTGSSGGSHGVPQLVVNPSGVISWDIVYATASYSCGIGNNGQIYCWGYNTSGQLGDNTLIDRKSPTPVINPSGVTRWSNLAVGNTSTCGIGNNGQAYCWGSNSNGQIGDNTTIDKPVPTLVIKPAGVTRWQSLTVRQSTSCGVGDNAQTYCWGANYNRTPTLISTPAGVTGWSSISIAANHRCAISGVPSDGMCSSAGLHSWWNGPHACSGNGGSDMLVGQTMTVQNTAPGLTGTMTIRCDPEDMLYTLSSTCTPSCIANGTSSGGNPTNCCNGDPDGNGVCGNQGGSCGDSGYCDNINCHVSCLGASGSCVNGSGNATVPLFGYGCGGQYCAPPCHANGSPVTCGDASSCCNGDPDGNGICGTQAGVCGSANGTQQLVAPSSNLCSSGAASAVSGALGSPWTWTCGGTACSANRQCAAMAWSWGSSNCSQSNTIINHGANQTITNVASGYTGTATISCTHGNRTLGTNSCTAAVSGGQLYCWGSASANGDGTSTERLVPTAVVKPSGVTSWTQVALTCALGNNSQAYCWGANVGGGVGDGTTTDRLSPVSVTNPSGVTSWTKISSSCGIGNNGNAYCWGFNNTGWIGDGSTSQRNAPTLVTKPSGVTSWTSIHHAFTSTCGIGNNGNAYCWGYNHVGQLGDGTTTDRLVPTLVTKPSGVTSWTYIGSFTQNGCGIGNNGNAYCWGSNNVSQIGDGTTTDRPVPTLVTKPSGVTSWTRIVAGGSHTCGIANTGNIYCWGSNTSGQIGDGTTTNRPAATMVTKPSGVTSWKFIDAGAAHNCAVGSNDRTYCWGRNTAVMGMVNGTIGDGTTTDRYVPTQVTNPSGVTSWLTTSTSTFNSCAIAN